MHFQRVSEVYCCWPPFKDTLERKCKNYMDPLPPYIKNITDNMAECADDHFAPITY